MRWWSFSLGASACNRHVHLSQNCRHGMENSGVKAQHCLSCSRFHCEEQCMFHFRGPTPNYRMQALIGVLFCLIGIFQAKPFLTSGYKQVAVLLRHLLVDCSLNSGSPFAFAALCRHPELSLAGHKLWSGHSAVDVTWRCVAIRALCTRPTSPSRDFNARP